MQTDPGASAEFDALLQRLAGGERVDDASFDRLLPSWARSASRLHWTPLSVATRVARLLTRYGATRVLDVGSGVGKFCVVGALTTPGVFLGVEQRPHFVEAARAMAERYRIERCSFLLGDVTQIDWTLFDAYYIYNAFAEHRMTAGIDETIPRSPWRYRKYVRSVRKKLATAPGGALLATYHGFGGKPPAGWVEILNEACGTGLVEVWRKQSA